MESLVEALKYSSPFDWLIIVLAFLLMIVGFLLLIVVRGRKPFYLFLVVALLPLLLGMLSTFLKYREVDRMMTMVEGAGLDIAGAARQEAWIITYIGAAGTAVLAVIALLGIMLKKKG